MATRIDDAERVRVVTSDGGRLASGFEKLYRTQSESVLRYFARRVADANDAADLTAETFAVVFASGGRAPRHVAPEAWLFGVAHKLLLKYQRHGRVQERARRRLRMDRVELDDESLARVEELADVDEARSKIREGLARMSPALAGALILKVGLDLPYEQVARRLGCSEQAARARVSRGLTQLAYNMEVDDG